MGTLGAAAYLTHPETGAFVWRNLLLAKPQYTLPGVFEANPLPAVGGSIWTLFHKVVCCLGVLGAGLAGLPATRRRAGLALLGFAAAWLAVPLLSAPLHPLAANLHALSAPFAIGVAFWVLRDALVLDLRLTAALGVLAWAASGTALAGLALDLAVAHLVVWSAFVPAGRARRFNAVGDYSHGIYVYAFPVQGLMVHLAGPQDPWLNAVLALPPTLPLAVLSWHLIERPALEWRHALALPRRRRAPTIAGGGRRRAGPGSATRP